VEWLNSFLPWFLVNALIFLQVLIATFIAKSTPSCPPEVTFISIHWTRQLHLTGTATSRTDNDNKFWEELIHLLSQHKSFI
jgi:hypothetical protein